MAWHNDSDCYGCQIDHLSQKYHMGENGCLNTGEDECFVIPELPEVEVQSSSDGKIEAQSVKASGWVRKMKRSLDTPSIPKEFKVHPLEKSSLEPGVKWGIQLPSLKRIQVVKGRSGDRFLEIRQFNEKKDGTMVADGRKFIRLTKANILAIYEMYDNIVRRVKEVQSGEDVNSHIFITDALTVNVTSPAKNINFRSWFSDGSENRRPGRYEAQELIKN
ncbi:hypothetical protein CAPTEDRAFT_192717 [Capitella teleta]|uniref:Uncharacterized protein n=1 Tax=Capitella teleta TaxID=283909 RepID=R7TFY4_CAPTE|nr:hypothetical protein CAPTEDRAFT_192717 [Capitella teleta]|eukprot:ELT92387.1 hypothetical protein CAPTEDRAFT_192717 [Capitella teleta]